MNRHILGVLPSILLAFTASAANWVYDPNAGTITDGDWTFAATVNGTALTVGACSADPGAVATLDFAKSVTSPDGATTYTITTLNPNFNGYADKANLVSLVLPASGLATISANAFNGCTALTNIVNYVPDSVTTLGASAFKSVPAAQALRLWGVGTVSGSAFYKSGITSATFGPALKAIYGSYDNGAFQLCASLKTLTFDEGIANATFTGYEKHFAGCTALEGVIDLSGFSSVLIGTSGTTTPFASCTKIEKIIFGKGLTKLGVSSISGLTGLRTLIFKGTPPAIYKTPSATTTSGDLFSGIPSDTPITTYIQQADTNAWQTYADSTINSTTSCWSTNWASGASQSFRPLIYEAAGSGGTLGDWVYDTNTATIARGAWTFAATKFGNKIEVNGCTAYPTEVSSLDFTGTVTDQDGNPLQIAKINTAFGTKSTSTTAGLKVGEVMFPTTVISIGSFAFSYCTALANVVPLLPDSVTTLGAYAFRNCTELKRPVSLLGVVLVDDNAFYNAAITAATFGPNLKSIWGNSFAGCTSLTNLHFDAAMSGGQFGSGENHFNGCSKLEGTLDLRGFSSVYVNWGGEKSPFRYCSKVTTAWLGAGLTNLSGAAFNDMTGLTNVVFYGNPPARFTASTTIPFLSTYTRTVTTHVYHKNRAAWKVYTAGGALNGKTSTWAESYIAASVDPSLRPLLLIDPPQEGTIVLIR